ncbi:hypothetical protein CUJ89_35905 [Burkholderia pyrrocinia]|uniref:Uncharacterized protein n=1 Tax=Burkholderia pyrrocinia TaxID=60550 RepID=A0A2Z5N9L6_BURPY|nr:hypothetical protein CUJ89_35905 [Burkholderia pyrrocinia]
MPIWSLTEPWTVDSAPLMPDCSDASVDVPIALLVAAVVALFATLFMTLVADEPAFAPRKMLLMPMWMLL